MRTQVKSKRYSKRNKHRNIKNTKTRLNKKTGRKSRKKNNNKRLSDRKKMIVKQSGGHISTTDLLSFTRFVMAYFKKITEELIDKKIKKINAVQPKYELYEFKTQDELHQFLIQLNQVEHNGKRIFEDTILDEIVKNKFDYHAFPSIIKVILSVALSPSILLAYFMDQKGINKDTQNNARDFIQKLFKNDDSPFDNTLVGCIELLLLNNDIINGEYLKNLNDQPDKYWHVLNVFLLTFEKIVENKYQLLEKFSKGEKFENLYKNIATNLPITFTLLEHILGRSVTINDLYPKRYVSEATHMPFQKLKDYMAKFIDQKGRHYVKDVSEGLKSIEISHGVSIKNIEQIVKITEDTRSMAKLYTTLKDLYGDFNELAALIKTQADVTNELEQNSQISKDGSEMLNDASSSIKVKKSDGSVIEIMNNRHINIINSSFNEAPIMETKSIASAASNDSVKLSELEIDYLTVLNEMEGEGNEELSNNNVKGENDTSTYETLHEIIKMPPKTRKKGIQTRLYAPPKPTINIENVSNKPPNSGSIYTPSTRSKPSNAIRYRGQIPSTLSLGGGGGKDDKINKSRLHEIVNMTQNKNILAYLFPEEYEPNIQNSFHRIILPPAILLILSMKLNNEGIKKKNNIFVSQKAFIGLFGDAPEEVIRKIIAQIENERGINSIYELRSKIHNVSHVKVDQKEKPSDKIIKALGKLKETLDDNENKKHNSILELLHTVIPQYIKPCDYEPNIQIGGGFGNILIPIGGLGHVSGMGIGAQYAKEGIEKIKKVATEKGKQFKTSVQEFKKNVGEKVDNLKMYGAEIAIGVKDINRKICQGNDLEFTDFNPVINRMHWKTVRNLLINQNNFITRKIQNRIKDTDINITSQYFIQNTLAGLLFKFPIEIGFIGKLFPRNFKKVEGIQTNMRHKNYNLMMYNIRFLQFIAYHSGIYNNKFITNAIYKGIEYQTNEDDFFDETDHIAIDKLISQLDTKDEELSEVNTQNNEDKLKVVDEDKTVVIPAKKEAWPKLSSIELG